MTSLEPRFERNPDFIFRKIVEETILVPVYQDFANMDCIYTLNELGAFVWEKIETPLKISDIVNIVMKEYEVDQQTTQMNLEQFFQEMEEIGAVRKI